MVGILVLQFIRNTTLNKFSYSIEEKNEFGMEKLYVQVLFFLKSFYVRYATFKNNSIDHSGYLI